MSTELLIELFGYFGSALVVVSMLMTSVVKLRVISTIGNLIFTIYAIIIKSYPTAFMDICLILINIYHLMRLMKKSDNHYELVDSKNDVSFVGYVLNHYKEDIKNFFPEIKVDAIAYDTAFITCCDGAPAGVLLGNMQKNGTLEVVLDYSTPAYRDCSVGEYLYSKLPAKGIKKVTFSGKTQKHEGYLQKMGFVKENGVYVKDLK